MENVKKEEKLSLKNLSKPPIGLVPSYIWKEKRVQVIKEAMKRYVDASKIIPMDWWDELNELVVSK